VGPGLLKAQLQAALDDAGAEAEAAPPLRTPIGGARLLPRATVTDVGFAPSAACEGCLEVRAEAAGTLQLELSTIFGPLAHALTFKARALTTAALGVQEGTAESLVHVRPVRDGAWAVSVDVEGAPPEVNELVSSALAERLEQALAAGLLPKLPLAEVPTDSVALLRGARARPARLPSGEAGVAVELTFGVLEAGVVASGPDPGDGFVVVVPARTLLGLARAAALRAEPMDGHVAEPLDVQLEGDRFLLELRVWRLAARPVPRDFSVSGRVVVEGGEVRVVPDRAEDRGGFTLDPLELLVRQTMLARLQEGLAAMLPAHHEQELLMGRRVAIEVQRVTGEEGALLLVGSVTLQRRRDEGGLRP
jgi:hypothetical protein